MRVKRRSGFYWAKPIDPYINDPEYQEVVQYFEKTDRFLRPGSFHQYRSSDFSWISYIPVPTEEEYIKMRDSGGSFVPPGEILSRRNNVANYWI